MIYTDIVAIYKDIGTEIYAQFVQQADEWSVEGNFTVFHLREQRVDFRNLCLILQFCRWFYKSEGFIIWCSL